MKNSYLEESGFYDYSTNSYTAKDILDEARSKYYEASTTKMRIERMIQLHPEKYLAQSCMPLDVLYQEQKAKLAYDVATELAKLLPNQKNKPIISKKAKRSAIL